MPYPVDVSPFRVASRDKTVSEKSIETFVDTLVAGMVW